MNPDGYYALQKGQTKLDSSIHLYFDYAIQAFRWIVRFGGQPFLSAAVAVGTGSGLVDVATGVGEGAAGANGSFMPPPQAASTRQAGRASSATRKATSNE